MYTKDMELIRIGDKLVDLHKVNNLITKIIEMRSNGSTQADVALKFGVERTFISHLEALGRIRKGRRVAIVGFPVKNIDEVEELAREFGVDFTFLLSESGRLDMANNGTAIDMFNRILDIVAGLRSYDTVIFLGSDKRIELMESIMDREMHSLSLGESPLTEDKTVDISRLEQLLISVISDKKGGHGLGSARGSKRKSWLLKKRPQRRSRVARPEL